MNYLLSIQHPHSSHICLNCSRFLSPRRPETYSRWWSWRRRWTAGLPRWSERLSESQAPHMYIETHSYTLTQRCRNTPPAGHPLQCKRTTSSWKKEVQSSLSNMEALSSVRSRHASCLLHLYPANQLCTTEPLLLIAVPLGVTTVLQMGNVTSQIKQHRNRHTPSSSTVRTSQSLTSLCFTHNKSFSRR